MPTRILIAWTTLLACAVAVQAQTEQPEFTKRGPLDKHAAHVQQVLDTLDLNPQQQARLEKIVADGHAAWRAWYQKHHEKVDAYQDAIRAANESGDKQRLAAIRKEKKVFMHTAPCLLRQPEAVRIVLSESQRKLFDERLNKLKQDLHQPAKKPTVQ